MPLTPHRPTSGCLCCIHAAATAKPEMGPTNHRATMREDLFSAQQDTPGTPTEPRSGSTAIMIGKRVHLIAQSVDPIAAMFERLFRIVVGRKLDPAAAWAGVAAAV